MATKTIYVVRHGATKLNNQTDLSEDRIRGWANVPLSPEGIQEAHKAAADMLSLDIDIIISSDLKRAADTANIIADTIHVPVHLTPLLRPWNLGNLQGQSTKDALPIIQRFVCDAPDKSVPGGESFHEFTSRAARGLKTAISVAGDKTPCIVTHHRDERFFCAWRDMGFPPDFKIKLSTFLQKGEAPGAVMPFDIPLDRLFGSENATAIGG
jgi:broad specificity phosphatase PhoE